MTYYHLLISIIEDDIGLLQRHNHMVLVFEHPSENKKIMKKIRLIGQSLQYCFFFTHFASTMGLNFTESHVVMRLTFHLHFSIWEWKVLGGLSFGFPHCEWIILYH